MSYVVDTNVLIDYPNVLDEKEGIIIPMVVLEEIDKLKMNKDRDRVWKARRATNKIMECMHKITLEVISEYDMPSSDWDKSKADNKIIMCAVANNAILISNDLLVVAKTKALKEAGVSVAVERYTSESYTGVLRLTGDTDTINEGFDSVLEDGLLENQYLIIHNVDTGEESEMVYRDGELARLRLPNDRVVKGWNAEQRCALDLLMNKDVPIKIICGVAGSGKTKLAVEMGLHFVIGDKQHEKLILVRNPIGSGEDVGFLPGSLEEKIGMFYAPIIENIDEGVEVVKSLEERGQLEKRIPFHMKGITLKDAFCLVDEAEDLDLKTLKLIGSRVGDNSVIVFSGDYKQSESKFVNNNGLMRLIDITKGNPLVGIIVLDTDVRSEASKVFADIDF
jgi:PhoH-like ATPase